VAQFPWTKDPGSHIVVVEGVNNTNVRLEWGYAASVRSSIVSVKIERKRDGTQKRIAVKTGDAIGKGSPAPLNLVDRNQDGREYEVFDPATLVLKEVNNDEEYEYVIFVDYLVSASSLETASKSVFVDVKGEEDCVHFYFCLSIILVVT